MTTYTDLEKFLQAVFGSDFGTRAIFANLNPPAHTRDFRQLDPGRDCYWSVAAFGPEAETHAAEEGATEVRALVIDDVGTKVSEALVKVLGEPTAIVESSFMNFQWVYRLSAPVPINEWKAFAEGVITKIGGPKRPEGLTNPVCLFRLPMGVNTKESRGGFKPQLVAFSPAAVFDRASITPIAFSGALSGGGADVKLNRVQLEALMTMIPNDLDRDGWIEVGHGLKALCENDDEGFEVFDTWSQQHDSYDAGKTRAAWDSFGASGLRTKGGQLRARAESLNPESFRKWEAAAVFDDGAPPPPGSKPAGITATLYQWVEPDKLPYRDWLYGKILIRRFISMTVAPGGVGKSSLIAAETMAQVTGRDLLGEKLAGKLRVWLWNLEDPYEETQRKIQAAALHYGISEADIGDRLFVDSGREQRLVIAQMDRSGGPMIVRPVVSALVEQIRLRGIDVVVVDPFVSCHEVPENDNTAQDMVVKEWGRVAELGNCAVHLVDHTRKAPAGTEVTTESSRGGKAKTDAARVVRVINRLTDAQSKLWSVAAPWRYFSAFNDKANMAPPVDRQDWFYLESIDLGNGTTAAAAFAAGAGAVAVPGDSVGVVKRWEPPKPSDIGKGSNFTKMAIEMGANEWRADYQAEEKWIGVPAARALELNHHSLKDRRQIREALSIWLENGLLKEVEQMDENRKARKYIKLIGGF